MNREHDIPELDAAGLRQFAFLIGGFVAVLFGLLLPWLLEHDWPRWPWIVAGVMVVWGTVAPRSLRLIYRGWMRFGLLMSRITTPLLMILTFFVVIVPTGLIARIFGYDALARRFDKGAMSYRVASKKAPRENLEKPY